MSAIVERVEPEIRVTGPLQVEVEHGPALAAALAAALVEYRRYVGQRNGHPDADTGMSNWQIVSRLEQLRSPA